MAEPTPPPAPWVHKDVIVDASPIAGQGLFAHAALDTGTVVIRLGGRVVTTSELEQLLRDSERYVDTITVFIDTHLVLAPVTSVHYGNHSCDPSLWHVGPYEIATRRPLKAGEELTIDYATHSGAPGFSMDCSCGTSECRGVVTSEDWRHPELQTRYAGHWVPALAARIAE
ncbi:MAG TPA: SET domain-containing protein-lysine N-methyltransferase [Acidimicrobiales bacterium]|nr:SET domain-containing protein-lysine N-methyltransferase [Acidimicrobiales bacterium]